MHINYLLLEVKYCARKKGGNNDNDSNDDQKMSECVRPMLDTVTTRLLKIMTPKHKA